MRVAFLCSNAFFQFGSYRYDSIKWLNEWYFILNLQDKYCNKAKTQPLDKSESEFLHILYFYDRNILQCICGMNPIENSRNFATTMVRLRIICGMVNKLDHNKFSIDMKYWIMQCFWDAFYKVWKLHAEWYGRHIANLPFQPPRVQDFDRSYIHY